MPILGNRIRVSTAYHLLPISAESTYWLLAICIDISETTFWKAKAPWRSHFFPKLCRVKKWNSWKFSRALLSYRIFHIMNRTSGTIVSKAPRDIEKHAQTFKIGTKRGILQWFSASRGPPNISRYIRSDISSTRKWYRIGRTACWVLPITNIIAIIWYR